MRLSFSIVINTLNRASYLRTALRSLRFLRHPHVEVIVVNGPSSDDTMAVLAGYPDIKVLHCPEANLSMSRNIGIAAAAGDIVCFLDDDAVPEPSWLDRLEAAYSDERVGAVGGFIRDHTGVVFQCRATVCDRFGDSKSYDTEVAALDAAPCEPGGWRFPSQTGCNSSFRRKALIEIGGFDEHYVYFLDETDVNVRLVDAGWRIRYAEGAEVHHKYASSALRDERRVPKSLYHSFRSKAYFACRNARGHKSLDQIFDYLAGHVIDIERHNRWYLDNKWIDRNHYDRLTSEMDQGLRDGVGAAFAGPRPHNAFADPPAFRPFSPQLPPRERLRIAFLSQEYPPGPVGGIAVWTHTLARTLAAAGHEITVIARSTTGHATVDFEDGVWVHRIVQEWQGDRSSPELGDLPQVIKDYAYCALDEVLRVHQLRGLSLVSWPIWDLEGVAVAAYGLIPNVMSMHTTYQMALPSKPDWLGNPEYRRGHVDKIIAGERRLLQTAPLIFANSQSVITDCEAAYGVSLRRPGVVLVPHGVEDAAAYYGERALDRSRRTLLFVGRLEPRKGADIFLEAVPDLVERRPDLDVRIIGRDDIKVGKTTLKEAFLRRWARAPWLSRVRFEGECDRERLMEAYRDCDLLATPSRYESFGLVTVEAMMFGRPVVASRAGGLSEIVVHEKTGLLAEPGDVVSFAACTARLIDDPMLRRAFGIAGRKRYGQYYSADAMRETVTPIYRRMIAGEATGDLQTPA